MAEEQEKKAEAVFNLGLSTLMTLHQMLTEIANVTISYEGIDKYIDGAKQKKKYLIIQQFLMNSFPLISNVDKKKLLLEDFAKIKLSTIPLQLRMEIKHPTSFVVFSAKVEDKLNTFILSVEQLLQEEHKFFMPQKGENSLF